MSLPNEQNQTTLKDVLKTYLDGMAHESVIVDSIDDGSGLIVFNCHNESGAIIKITIQVSMSDELYQQAQQIMKHMNTI